MRSVLTTVFASLLFATAAMAQDGLSTARDIIEKQISAFLNDDIETAYSFAAAGIKAAYPDPRFFVEMVKRNYGPVYRPGNYAFGRGVLGTDGNTIAQELLITGPRGKDWRAVYVLEKQADGAFRITGVRLSKLSGSAI